MLSRNTSNTVRSDVEERFAEERLAWNDKNVPAWPKNISVLWNFGPIHSALYEEERDKNAGWR